MASERVHKCAIAECKHPVQARGWCSTHYWRWWSYGDSLGSAPPRVKKPRQQCIEPDCDDPATGAKERCEKHHRRWRYANDPEYRARKRREGTEWNRQNRDYWREHNRNLIENETAEQRARRLSRVRNKHLAYKYGITAEDYEAMWVAQAGLCRICQQPESRIDVRTGKVNLLAVDHDAQTGRVRGLLCSRCNRAIGLFEEQPALLSSAAAYLAS